MRPLLLTALCGLLLSAQASAASVSLQNGQTGQLGNQKIVVLSVKDSRCPMNARCIRAGELVATVLVSQDNHLRLVKLQTPEKPNTAWAGLRISEASQRLPDDKKTPLKVTFSDERS